MSHDGQLSDVDYGRMIDALNRVHYEGETAFYDMAPLRAPEEALSKRVASGSRILDVGCGAGRVTKPARSIGLSAVGLDINQAALRVARASKPEAPLTNGRMDALPFASRSFDQVWCLRFSFNALPTDGERVRTLQELWRVCDVGGTVVVEAFNWYFPGRLGLLRLANLLDGSARRVRWLGHGRTGSPPLPARDLIYLASKAPTAAPGYAHLTTVNELRRLAAVAGLADYLRLTNQAGLISGQLTPVRSRHHAYATWLVLTKPSVLPIQWSER
jgi:SAM-dependent methyltransferase